MSFSAAAADEVTNHKWGQKRNFRERKEEGKSRYYRRRIKKEVGKGKPLLSRSGVRGEVDEENRRAFAAREAA